MNGRNDDPARRGWQRERHGDDLDRGEGSRTRRHGYGTAIIGIGVLALGAVFLLDNFDLIDGYAFYPYWPVLFILVGISHFVRPRGSRRYLTGVIFIAVGAVWVAANLGYLSFDLWDLWPVVLIIFGARLMLRPFLRRRMSRGDVANVFEATAILGGANRTLSSADFQGGIATAIMGGCEIDLRDCGSEGGPAEIDTFAFWGGVDIRVPEDWEVEVRGVAVLGAFEDNSTTLHGTSGKVLIVRGIAIMGGVEVKN
jgi:predicted membrane protein